MQAAEIDGVNGAEEHGELGRLTPVGSLRLTGEPLGRDRRDPVNGCRSRARCRHAERQGRKGIDEQLSADGRRAGLDCPRHANGGVARKDHDM